MPFSPGETVLMFTRGLVPRLREMLIAAPTASSMRYEYALSRRRQIRDRLSRLIIQRQRAHRHLQNHIFARVPRAVRAFPMPSAVRLKLAIVAVAQQRIVVQVRFEIHASAVPSVPARRPST